MSLLWLFFIDQLLRSLFANTKLLILTELDSTCLLHIAILA